MFCRTDISRRAPKWAAVFVAGASLAMTVVSPAFPANYTFVNIVDDSGPFDQFGFGGASINSSGTVAFKGVRGGVPGIFTGSGGPITTIADTTGAFNGVGFGASINDSGVVAFSGSLDAGGTGIFAGSGGTTTPIIDSSGPFNTFQTPAINNSGTVAFSAALDGGHEGIYVTSGGAPTTIADLGGIGMQDFLSFNDPMVNNAGTVAFNAFSSFGGGGGGSGIFSGNGGPVTTIKYSGVMAGFFDSGPSINDSGTVAYVQLFSTGSSTLFTFSGGINTPLATSNSSGPLAGFQSPHISSAGEVAFLGYYVPQPNEGFGIFTGPDPDADRVLLVGNALFGSTVTSIDLSGGRRLNDRGDIVFGYALANGVAGIAVAQTLLPGDYNGDGTVDAADYVPWRKNDGTQPAYDTWRTHFGENAGGGSSSDATVPESTSVAILILGAAVGAWTRRRTVSANRFNSTMQ